MKKTLLIFAMVLASFSGGIFAQTVGGSGVTYAMSLIAPLLLQQTTLNPTGVVSTMRVTSVGLGDNATFKGISNGFFAAIDDASVTPATKGVLYGLQLSVQPKLPRTNSPFDDVGGLIVQNDSTNASKGTEAIYVGHNPLFTAGALEWAAAAAIGSDANGDIWGYGTGTYRVGLDLCRNVSVCATVTGAPISSPLITPASSSATCSQGWMAWDSSFIYVCSATNTWKRAALAVF